MLKDMLSADINDPSEELQRKAELYEVSKKMGIKPYEVRTLYETGVRKI